MGDRLGTPGAVGFSSFYACMKNEVSLKRTPFAPIKNVRFNEVPAFLYRESGLELD